MSDLPPLNQRVKLLIDTFYNGNVTAFSRAIGYSSPQKVNRLFKIDPRSGKHPEPSTSILTDISNMLDNINQTWLMSGTGDMLKQNAPSTETKSNAKPIMINDLNVTMAPLIGQYAQAGYLSGFADPEYLEKQPLYVATRKYSGGNYVAFEIRGDSMDNDRRNAICNGDVVLGRELYKDYWLCKLHIPKVFIIVHKEEGILLKEITDHDVDSGIITCHSYNPDKTRYPDFQLHLKDVAQLFYMKELSRGNE